MYICVAVEAKGIKESLLLTITCFMVTHIAQHCQDRSRPCSRIGTKPFLLKNECLLLESRIGTKPYRHEAVSSQKRMLALGVLGESSHVLGALSECSRAVLGAFSGCYRVFSGSSRSALGALGAFSGSSRRALGRSRAALGCSRAALGMFSESSRSVLGRASSDD